MNKLKICILLSMMAILVGCATNWQTTAGQSLGTVAQTVDTAMKGWATYVVVAKPTQADQDRVRAMYAQYQASFALALASYNAAVSSKDQTVWQQADAALIASQTQLLNVLNAFNITTNK